MTTYALLHTIFFFFVYAFLGWCVEVAYAAITTRELVNRGFLNGPICPIYGCGMTVMIAVLGRFTMPSSDMAWYQNVLVAFFGGMVITTLVELVGGYILYKMFHTRWWDYSMYRFNLGGFICPQFSLLWGLGSVLLMVVVHPLLSKPSAAIPTLVLIWLDVIFGGLFLADLIVSAIQAVGFSKQLARIDELRKAMRTTSDALTEVIGTSAMTMDTLLDEQKLQLTLAAMEGPLLQSNSNAQGPLSKAVIVRKCALQAVDSLRFPSVCQIQHTAHTGKLFIVRSADRLFEKLLLPVWVRLRKREAQFGTACCCDLGKLRCMPVHTVDFCRLIGEKMGESLMKCVSIQSCQIVCTFQCGICRRIAVSNQEMRNLMRQQIPNDAVELVELRIIAPTDEVKDEMCLPVGRVCRNGVVRLGITDDQIKCRLYRLPIGEKRVPNRAVDGDKVRSRFTDTAFELAHSLSESKILRRRRIMYNNLRKLKTA